MSGDTQKTVSIIGGGFSGTSTAIHQINHYRRLCEEGHQLPPVTIYLFDKNGWFGTGLPYHTQDSVFLLNQPANAMSPFPDDPEHFTRWLGKAPETFATRHEYGVYLRETLQQVFNKAVSDGLNIKLEVKTDEIIGINVTGSSLVLSAASTSNSLETDAVIIATGHERGKFLHSLEENLNFFASDYSAKDVQNILKDAGESDSVAIVGTGQSMLDALAVLDHIGYKGKIYALSRDGVLPWPYDPAVYSQQGKPSYRPAFLSPPLLADEKDWSFQKLKGLFQDEIAHATKNGYGIGHVLVSIDFDGLKKSAPPEHELERFQQYWKKVYGNPTAPERYALFQQYQQSGRLVIIESGVDENSFHKNDNNTFSLETADRAISLELKAVFNAAAYDRKSLASPLLRQLDEAGAISTVENTVPPGQQQDKRLFVVGPPVSPEKWGVETFRQNNVDVAQKSLRYVLNI